ncbi:metallophosphoesterase [Veillonella sp.]|uniref:metallophosphoesterase n=1 Tax=Veillonella sp. TaxID=1926307 RepID=UPI0025F1D29D|nr:metallophosphoesterase [Veillonella sp.]
MTLDAMTIRMIFNVVIVLIVVGGLTGFWYLVLKLLQPEKKIWWWLGYIVVVIGLGVSMRHFIINQVELFGTSSYLPLQLLRTETYGFMMGILLAIPVLLVMLGIQWLVNRNSKSVEPEMGSSRRKFFQTAAVAIPAATIGGASYAAFRGQSEIKVTHETFRYKNLPNALRHYKISQISDVHLGPCIDLDDFDIIVNLVLKEKPDRVVITGDLIDKIDWLPELSEKIKDFAKQVPDGIDYIIGNHEYFRDAPLILETFRTKTPMRVLVNQHVKIFDGPRPVYIAGVDYDLKRKKSNRELILDETLNGIPKDAFVILLAHHPEFFEEAFARKIPLTLSGHTHGGQIVIGGQSLVPIGTPYWKGRYSDGESQGYVNNGTGHWYPVRLDCPREITIVQFKDADRKY